MFLCLMKRVARKELRRLGLEEHPWQPERGMGTSFQHPMQTGEE